MHDKWLITGGCGFIGTALIRRLLTDNPGISIRILDNQLVGGREDLAQVCDFTEDPAASGGWTPGVTLVEGDIMDEALAVKATRGAQVVVHLAANTGVPKSVENPRRDMEYNVVGTFNMLEAARQAGTKHFVFASSGAPAGEVVPPIHEEMAPHPASPYGASKLAGEGYCSAYARTFGLKTTMLRFGNVYGPGSGHKTSVVAKFIKKALAGQPCEIYGDGTQTRDFIYIEDLLDAVLLAAHYDKGGEAFQIATNKESTVLEMAELLAAELERHGIEMQIRHGEKRLGDVMRNFSDTSKARDQLGWTFKTTLTEGLAPTVDSFLSS